jgi:hypothetical protein
VLWALEGRRASPRPLCSTWSRRRSVVDVDAIAITYVVTIDRVLEATTAVLESTAKMGGPADLGLAEQKRGPWLAL